MKAVNLKQEEAKPRGWSSSLGGIATKLLVLMVFTAFASFFVIQLLSDGYWQFAIVIGIITLMLDIIFLREEAYPLRWMSPGLSFMILLSLYPIVFTIYIAFTNFGTGNLLPKVQTIEVLGQRTFLPEEGISYEYTALRDQNTGAFALWLIPPDGGDGFLITENGRLTASEANVGAIGEDGVPATIPGYALLSRVDLVRAIDELGQITFGGETTQVQITGQLGRAAELQPRYVYDEAQDAILDRQNDVLYIANETTGYFTSTDGQQLTPGYQTTVGFLNFERFFTNPSFRGPLLRIFIWTFFFALLSVVFSFSLGLTIALAFGRDMPGQKLIKSMLIIPFAVPQVITILIWRGLLNPLNGVVSTTLAEIFNQPVGWPPIFADQWWVKAALLLVNVWLAYPYFMLINSGALQAIPQDMFEAADIDGANAWQKFRNLTLPLLLVGVGPLLLSSFTANFNSFNVIFLFNSGGPPIVGTSTPAGHSDILISYVYRLAFGTGGGQDYGYASAITIIIFFLLLVVTLIQFRYMQVWEEVGENV